MTDTVLKKQNSEVSLGPTVADIADSTVTSLSSIQSIQERTATNLTDLMQRLHQEEATNKKMKEVAATLWEQNKKLIGALVGSSYTSTESVQSMESLFMEVADTMDRVESMVRPEKATMIGEDSQATLENDIPAGNLIDV